MNRCPTAQTDYMASQKSLKSHFRQKQGTQPHHEWGRRTRDPAGRLQSYPEQSRAECIVMMLTHKMQQRNALQVMCRKEAGDGSRHQAQVLGLGAA